MDADTLRRAVREIALAADDPAWASAVDGLLRSARKPACAPAIILRARFDPDRQFRRAPPGAPAPAAA